MFTGIIQEMGRVRRLTAKAGNLILDIESRKLAPKISIGDSISINGVCQTVISRSNSSLAVEAIKETLDRTNSAALRRGVFVNLELPLSLGDLIHGHLVQGHVDCTGRIAGMRPLDGSTMFWIECPARYQIYLIEKGSVAVDGVSLTVVGTQEDKFSVSVIPHTMNNTVFQHSRIGDRVNLEFDMIAKHIEKIVSHNKSEITIDFLKEHGFLSH
jgi:riboflavin synthase